MASAFVPVPVELDEATLEDAAFGYLMANLPGWVPSDSHVETWLVQTFVRIVLVWARAAALVPTAIFRYYGRNIIGFDPLDAATATANTTWTMVDAAGYTIRSGTFVAFRVAGDQLIPFTVDGDVVVPPGSTATAAGAVTIRAITAGTEANGLSGPVELIDTVSYVAAVTTATATSGGADGETDAAYLDRLVEELALLGPHAVVPADFEVLARRVSGVHRALAVDGYNPADSTTGNERMIAVAVVDVAGAALGSGVKTAVEDLLESLREVNFVVNVIDPTTTTIDVAYTATAATGFDPAAVETAVDTALAAYLSPAAWGGGQLTPPEWQLQTVVRYFDVVAVIENTIGVDHLDTLTIEGGTTNVTLTGVAPLTAPGTIAGTVS